jgi:integrase
MGFSRRRPGRDGRPRYTAYFLDIRGQERSAGTFARKREADEAWQNAEAAIRAGRRGDPGRGKRSFEAYVLDDWLPYHQLEPGVRSEYARQIRKHLLPFFGPMKMRDIMPEQVRQWVSAMQAKGARPRTIQYCKVSILNAIFTTALADEVVTIHPSRGVKTPPVPKKPRRIITATEFDLLYQALPDADTRLLVETDIESGLRWGELTELRPRDLDVPTRILTVSRAVVEVPCEEHPSGGRFLVKDYPKDKEYRRLKLSAQISAKIAAHIRARRLGPDDLLFSYRAPGPAREPPPRDRRSGRLDRPGRQRPAVPARDPHGLQRRGGAGASAAVARTPPTGPPGGPPARTARVPGAPGKPTGTSRPTGSAVRCGTRRGTRPGCPGCEFMTCATRTPRGCSLVARTCRWSRSASATPASSPRSGTCTPCPLPTRAHWMRFPGSVARNSSGPPEPGLARVRLSAFTGQAQPTQPCGADRCVPSPSGR